MKKSLFTVLSIILLVLSPAYSGAEENAKYHTNHNGQITEEEFFDGLTLAVAADFAQTAKRLGEDFEARTNIAVRITSGASGTLTEEIREGGEADVFMSANTQYPKELVAENLAIPDPIVYAYGTIALYATDRDLSSSGKRALESGDFAKIAVADPKHAPYGQATIETLTKLGLMEKLQGTIVYAKSIAQALEMVKTGEVNAAFVAFPDLARIEATRAWLVPETMHKPIKQAAVQLTAAPHPVHAEKWTIYIEGDIAKRIIRYAGYRINNGQ